MAKNKKDTFGVADDLQFIQEKYDTHNKHNTHDKHDTHSTHNKQDKHSTYDKHDTHNKHEKHNTHSKHDKHDKHNTHELQWEEQYEMKPEEVKSVIEQPKEILKNFPQKQGRPKKSEGEKLRGYRYNLNLDRDLKEYLHEVAWRKRTSITQYINDLIRVDMENDAGWKKEKE